MATDSSEAQRAILDLILEEASSTPDPSRGIGGKDSRKILHLAESWAWLRFPNQSHGGPPAVPRS